MLMICVIAAGCAQQAPKPPAAVIAPAKPAVMDPFRFHKLIEVSPGNDFDVVSWGRGSKDVGAFAILHSDSANIKYTTTTGDLEGSLVDVYNSDMDLDGNPEILIQAKAKDTSNYAIIYAFEFTNGRADKLDFPKLTKSQRKGYRGDDNFYIQDGKFMRQFPIYDGDGKDTKPTGQKRLLQYGLRNNEFTVQTLSTDSASNAKQTVSQPAKPSSAPVAVQSHKSSSTKKNSSSSNNSSNNSSKKSSKSSSSSSKKKRHHTEEKKTTSHKKKKRHHHTDDN
jgi:hypothetical protein